MGCRKEGVEYSLRREEFGGRFPCFSSQLHIPEGRRDFCPYLALMGSVMALVHDGDFSSARLILF